MGVRVGDQVEGDVDAAGIRRHGGGVLIDRVFVQRVDLRRLGRSPSGADILGHGLELRRCAAGEEDPGALSRECPSNCAADRSAPAVDHSVLVLKQHVYLLKSWPTSRSGYEYALRGEQAVVAGSIGIAVRAAVERPCFWRRAQSLPRMN